MSRVHSPLRDRMVFAFGAPRSGTFWLQRIITSHPDVSAIPTETHLFSHGIAPLLDLFHHGARSSPTVARLYVERETLLDAARDFCDVAFIPFLEPDARYLAERTPFHSRHAALIADVYPDARFVHIIRDGRDVARSIAAQPWGPETISAAAEEWRSSVEAARAPRLPDGQYREVRYEELLADPEPVIAALFEWLGVPASESVLNVALEEARAHRNVDKHGRPGIAAGKWRDTFTPEDLADFQRVAGDLVAELGYPVPGQDELRPKRRPFPRDGFRGTRHRLRRRLRPASGAPLTIHRCLRLANRALDALLASRSHKLEEFMEPEAAVKVISQQGMEMQRGAAGRELLERTLAGDGAFTGRQVRGDVYPGVPTVGYVLSLESNSRQAADRAISITIGVGPYCRTSPLLAAVGRN